MNKTISLAALAAISATALLAAAPASAGEVEIRNAVARVIVMVENRSDIAVEVQQGAGALPQVQVSRRGDDIRIEGGLERNAIRSCRGGSASSHPGQGASVEVRSVGRVNLMEAPLIVIRSPREVDISATGAVFGSIGRGATRVELGSAGCGDWTVANVDGELDVSVAGSGDIRAGTSRELEASVAGSGRIQAGATGDLKAEVGGSGDVNVARVNGRVDLAVGGSGDITVRAGRASRLKAAVGGSGDIRFDGEAGDVSAAVAGSGDIRIRRATGQVSRSTAGSGTISVGS